MPDLPDKRFKVFDAELHRETTRVISFDCFDTLLWRRVPKPTDLHLLVGERMWEAGVFASHITPHGYAHLRVLAEQEARRRQVDANGSSEVTLEEIHDLLEPAIATKSLYGLGAATEFQIERENVFADARLASYLRGLLQEVTVRLITVSDTYFNGDQLRALLAQPQLRGVEFESIYTSSQARTGKGGHLWERVLEDLQIEADQLVHVGDNEEADVSCARRIGIRAFHYPTNTDRFGPVEIRERIVGDGTYPTQYCDRTRGDAGITAIRRRATWASPGREIEDEKQVAWETGTSVFGPVFTGFAEWVHEQSRSEGARRLLFLMREGRFLKELADRAAPVDSWKPSTRTVWVSREACARASIYEGSAAELQDFLARLRTPCPSELATSLGLEASDVADLDRLDREFALSRERDMLARSFLDLVLERPDLVEKMVTRSADRRARLMGHVRRMAGPGEGPVGLVDVGWSASIQESLEVMFKRSDDPLDFRGFYLLAHVGSSERVLRGSRLQGFLGTVGTNPFDIAAITSGAEIIELVSTCEDGSLLEMGENDQPILAAPVAREQERACRKLVQQGVLAYQSESLGYRQPDLPTFETTPTGVNLLTRILKRFVSLPNDDEAIAFTWWLHEENYGSQEAEQLVPPRYLSTLRHRSAEDLHWAPMSDLHWTGGAAALVDNEMSDAIFHMREATVDPGRFSSPPEGQFRLIVRGEAEETITVPVVRNRHGLSLVEWRNQVRGATGVVLRPAEAFTLVRFDFIEVVDEGAGANPGPLFRWSRGSDRQLLPTDGVRWVTSQVMAVDDTSTITINFPIPVVSPELRVTVAGAFVPVAADPPDAPVTSELETEIASLQQEIENLHRTKLFRFSAFPRRVYGAIRKR